ncbi:hypothetical protein K7432_012736 [Basidiobolus ranarum]|uniref:NADPH--hemoprotein reductase n=1 Tax=Basidiobolus ranarum TaxID=34480 RepID=A0ABR2VRT9_9FUNG
MTVAYSSDSGVDLSPKSSILKCENSLPDSLTQVDTALTDNQTTLRVSFSGEDESKSGVSIQIQPYNSMEDVKRECGQKMNISSSEGIEFHDRDGEAINSVEQLISKDVAFVVLNGTSYREIATPPTVPLFGTLPYILPDVIGSVAEFFKEYDSPLLQLYSFQRRSLTTNHPAIAELFAQENEYFTKKIVLPFAEVKAIGGDGLFTTDSDEQIWKLAHKLLMPAFSASAMKAYATEMAKLGKKLVNVLEDISGGQEPVLISPWMTKITFETIGRVGFGFDFGLLESKDSPIHPFIDAMSFCLGQARTRAFRSQYWKLLPIWSNYQFDRMMKLMKDTVDEVIVQRKSCPQGEDESKDLLGFMLNASDKSTGQKLPDEVIRDQVVTFLIAGHETTSNTLSWCLYCLAKNPAILKNVLQEIANVGINNDDLPTTAQISRLKYLTQVLKETLRMYPPLALLQKSCIKDCRLPFGYFAEEGTVVQVQIYALHHNPNIWENPSVFNPDRFNSSEESKRSRYSWLPFSIGARGCIGLQFAMQEAKIILAMLLRKFEFQLPDDKPIHIDIASGAIIKPKDLYFNIKRRTSFPEPTTQPPSEGPTAFTQLSDALTISKAPPSNIQLPKFTVLFGSNMGMSEEYANKVAGYARNLGFSNVDITSLDDWEVLTNGKYESGEIHDEKTKPIVMIITSTYNGFPPDNAVEFDKFISANKESGILPFNGLRYAVFGCGNKQWRTYQNFPKKVNDRMEFLGAEQLFPVGAGNADSDVDADFAEWLARFYAALLADFGLEGASLGSLATSNSGDPTKGVSLQFISAENLKDKPSQPKEPELAIIRKNMELQNVESSGRSTRHLEIQLPEDQIYQTGDHLEIFPENDPNLVEEVAITLGYALDAVFEVKIEDSSNSHLSSRSLAANLKGPHTVRHVLTNYADLQAAPSRQFIGVCLSAISQTESEKQYFESMCQTGEKGSEIYTGFVKQNRCLIDLLKNYPMIKTLNFLSFLCAMPVMTKRRYSIASCPQVHKNVAHLCVGIVEDVVQNKIYKGLCTGFLSNCNPGKPIRANIRNAKDVFHLPEDPTVPLIMVCAGTGIAPFRGFLQERRLKGCKSSKKGGESTTYLFFGCRSPEHDFIYKDELEEFVADGTLDQLTMAFSRIGDPKRYVQHNLLASAALVWDLIHNKGGAFYVCGSASGMARDVSTTVTAIFEQVGGLRAEEAHTYFQQLQQHGKYNEDVWG